MSEPPNKGKRIRRQSHGWFASKPHSYSELIKDPLVEPWIIRYREGDSQESYARALERILDATGMSVKEFLALPTDEAKRAVFSVADAIRKEGKYAQAKKVVIAAKGFFETHKKPLELDKLEKKKYYATPRKKVVYEVIPNKVQVYGMADASLSLKAGLRNRAMILCLYQSGVRENCLCRWTYGIFKDQLYPEVKVPVKLVITSEMDVKLQSYGLGYYITFLQRDAAEALKAYLEYRRRRGWRPKDEDPVFVTESTASRGEPLEPQNIWEVIKQPQVVSTVGIDPHGMWVRLLRKAFQKILNQSDIDEDTKEALMGHKLPGSRGNYFDSHDHDEIAGKYMRCQFDRAGQGGPATKYERLKQYARDLGFDPEDIIKEQIEAKVPRKAYKGRTPSDEEKRRLVMALSEEERTEMLQFGLRQRLAMNMPSRRTAHNGGTPFFETRIISDEKELLPLLDEGWDILKELAGGRIVVRRPNRFDE